MCGLTGFIGKSDFNLRDMQMLLLWNGFERGMDSTGIFSPVNGIKKSAKDVTEFMIEESVKPDKLFIGHTRAKTYGAVTAENAHPFKYGDIIGAHNGTLQYVYDLCHKNNLKYEDYNVDSKILIKLLSSKPDFKILSEYEGAAALLFYDELNGILYAYRDKERPLFKGKKEEGIYFSSLEDSLKLIGCTSVKELKENALYSFKDGEFKEYKNIKRKDPVKAYRDIEDSVEEMVGCWLKADISCGSTYLSSSPLITKDNFYQVIQKTGNKVIVKDDVGSEQTITLSYFNEHLYRIIPGAFAKTMVTLTYKENNKTYCDEGTKGIILKIYTDKTALFKPFDDSLGARNVKFCYLARIKFFDVDFQINKRYNPTNLLGDDFLFNVKNIPAIAELFSPSNNKKDDKKDFSKYEEIFEIGSIVSFKEWDVEYPEILTPTDKELKGKITDHSVNGKSAIIEHKDVLYTVPYTKLGLILDEKEEDDKDEYVDIIDFLDNVGSELDEVKKLMLSNKTDNHILTAISKHIENIDSLVTQCYENETGQKIFS